MRLAVVADEIGTSIEEQIDSLKKQIFQILN